MSQETIDRALATEAAEEAGRDQSSWKVPAIVGSALMLQALESTIITNALPSMARAFHEEPLRLNMAITMFLLASAVFLPVSGWIADKFGAKRVFVAAMMLFALSSAGCGFAQTLPQLIVARVLQGASAAMMTPVARLLLLRTTPKRELVGALAIFTMPAMFAPLLGPVLGGFIVTYFDWRWIFFINLPIAVAGVALVRAYVPDLEPSEVPPMDWVGVALCGAGLAALVFGLENLGQAFLPAWQVAGLFALGLASLALYWGHARDNPNAVIDFSVFRIRSFNAAVVGGGFMRIGIGAAPFLLAMLLQVGFGMSAFSAGLMVVTSSLGALMMKAVTPPLLRRFGFYRVLMVNGVVAAGTYLIFVVLTPDMPRWWIMLLLGVGGFFRSLQFTALGSLTFADIDQPQMSGASTVSSMAQQLMQTVGVGCSAVILHVTQNLRGESHLTWQAVGPAFVALSIVSLLSLAWLVRLPRNVGDEMSGRIPT